MSDIKSYRDLTVWQRSMELAEGNARGSRKDYARFISIARGSTVEVSTFLMLALRVKLAPQESITPALSLCEEVGRMLNALHRTLT